MDKVYVYFKDTGPLVSEDGIVADGWTAVTVYFNDKPFNGKRVKSAYGKWMLTGAFLKKDIKATENLFSPDNPDAAVKETTINGDGFTMTFTLREQIEVDTDDARDLWTLLITKYSFEEKA
jgi:hypothetical protein